MIHLRTNLLVAFLVFYRDIAVIDGFSASSSSGSFTLFDRFTPTCPAESTRIAQFDPSLIQQTNQNDESKDKDEDKEAVWVAVYRSANNKPSVFVKDEFLNAMRLATGGAEPAASSTSMPTGADAPLIFNEQQQERPPVAVARLRPAEGYPNQWVIDSMRCSLKKENTDAACDGGSEFTEALCVAVDALLLHHLSKISESESSSSKYDRRFDGAIRVKSTLFSSRLFEERGFEPVKELQKDMATHISSLDASIEQYAQRSVDTSAKNPGSRDRAMQMLSLLSRLDREEEIQATQEENSTNDEDQEDADYDPWASVKSFF